MRAWQAILVVAAVSTLFSLISLPASASPASISGGEVVEVNATFPSLLNITLYIPRVIPYNDSFEAIAPIDIAGCELPFYTFFSKNFTLYGEISGEVDYFEVVLYDTSSSLPVLSLVASCSRGLGHPLPLVAKYYKSSIEALLGGKREVEVELRVGKLLYTQCYTECSTFSEGPTSSSPEAFRIVLRRVGVEESTETGTVTVTSTVTKTVYSKTTITETLPMATTVTVTVGETATLTRTVTMTSTLTRRATTTITVTETVPRETSVETVTKTLYRTLYKTVPLSTATTVTVARVVEKPRSPIVAELAASLIALVVSFTAFAVAVKNMESRSGEPSRGG